MAYKFDLLWEDVSMMQRSERSRTKRLAPARKKKGTKAKKRKKTKRVRRNYEYDHHYGLRLRS